LEGHMRDLLELPFLAKTPRAATGAPRTASRLGREPYTAVHAKQGVGDPLATCCTASPPVDAKSIWVGGRGQRWIPGVLAGGGCAFELPTAATYTAERGQAAGGGG